MRTNTAQKNIEKLAEATTDPLKLAEIRAKYEKLELLKQCDGKHTSLEEVFDCKSCDVMFQD